MYLSTHTVWSVACRYPCYVRTTCRLYWKINENQCKVDLCLVQYYHTYMLADFNLAPTGANCKTTKSSSYTVVLDLDSSVLIDLPLHAV